MNSKYAFALALTAFGIGIVGCSADAGPAASDSRAPETVSQATNETVIETSAATRAATGIAYFSLDAAGRGKAMSMDGSVIASFTLSAAQGKHALHIETNGLVGDYVYAVTKTNEGVSVAGTANGVPFDARFGLDGRPIEGGTHPSLEPGLDMVVRALHHDLQTYSEAHTTKGCALAGLGIIVSTLTLEPWGIGLGFIGIVAECGD